MAVYDGHNVTVTKGGTEISGVTSIKLPDCTYASIQTTNTGTDTHTQRQGLAQWGTADIEMIYAGSAHDALNATGSATYVVSVADADGSDDVTVTFDGFVVNYSVVGNETDNNSTATLSVQLEDEPT